MKKYLPFFKLSALIINTTLLLFIKNPLFIFGYLVLLLLFIFFTPVKFKLKNRLTSLVFVAAMVTLFQVLFNTQSSLLDRLTEGLTAGIKIITLSLLVFSFTYTTSPREIVRALSFLPKKFCFVLAITLALLPAILEESRKIMLAQQTRGLNFRRFNFLKTILPVVVPLLHLSFKRTEQLVQTMYARGYNDE